MKLIFGLIVIGAIIAGVYLFRSKPKARDEVVDHYTCHMCGERDCVCHKDEETG